MTEESKTVETVDFLGQKLTVNENTLVMNTAAYYNYMDGHGIKKEVLKKIDDTKDEIFEQGIRLSGERIAATGQDKCIIEVHEGKGTTEIRMTAQRPYSGMKKKGPGGEVIEVKPGIAFASVSLIKRHPVAKKYEDAHNYAKELVRKRFEG